MVTSDFVLLVVDPGIGSAGVGRSDKHGVLEKASRWGKKHVFKGPKVKILGLFALKTKGC